MDVNLIKKSILFEVIQKNNPNKPVEAFTLIIPPSSIEVNEPQRTNYTKTFGGVFLEDYGPDEIKIVISGDTGNSDLKTTFYPSTTDVAPPEKMSGKGAFYYFRDHIMRYKDTVVNYEQYSIMIYDLSTIPQELNDDTEGMLEGFSDSYEVNLDNFKMSRSKDKPMFFNYTIEMTVIRKTGQPILDTVPPIKAPNPMTLIESIRRTVNVLNNTFSGIRNVINEIEGFMNLVNQLGNQINAYYNQTVDLLIYPSSLARLVVSKAKDIFDAVQNTGPLYEAAVVSIYEHYLETVLLVGEMIQSSACLVTTGKQPDTIGASVERSSKELSTLQSSAVRYDDLDETEVQIPDIVTGVDTSEVTTTTYYGYEVVVVTAETTLERLAMLYYGNASLQETIALYNNLPSVHDLEIGSTLKIPVLLKFSDVNNNYVYTTLSSDVYGTDILLDERFVPVVGESGDFLTISDAKNVIQALNLRLNENFGARIRMTLYGIKSSVGSAMRNNSSVSYLISNIKDTVLQDPRITSIDKIGLKGSGDSIFVSFDCKTIKIGETLPFANKI